MSRTLVFLAVGTVVGAGACNQVPLSSAPECELATTVARASVTLQVEVRDEGGAAIPNAEIDLGFTTVRVGSDGRAALENMTGPALAVVKAPGG